jgi:hypothetical protein
MVREDDKKKMSEYTFKPKILKKSEQMLLNKSRSGRNEEDLSVSNRSQGAVSKCNDLYLDAKQRKKNLKQLEIKYQQENLFQPILVSSQLPDESNTVFERLQTDIQNRKAP